MHQVAVAKLEDRRAKIGCSCSDLCLVLCCHFYLLIFRTQHEEELQAGTQLGHMRLVSCSGSAEMDTWEWGVVSGSGDYWLCSSCWRCEFNSLEKLQNNKHEEKL